MEGYSCLLSSGAPDSYCSLSGADLLPFLAQTIVAALGPLVHRTLSGARSRPLELPRVARRLRGRPFALATVGSPDSPVRHRTVRWIIATSPFSFPESDEFVADDSSGSPVHHRTVQWIIAVRHRRVSRAAFSLGLAWRTRQSGVPGRAGLRLHTTKSFAILFFSSFLCF
jgi:hypothetical protein